MAQPPLEAEAAFLSPTSDLISRIEIYHADGTTRWLNGANDDRLILGNVSVDQSRDERRSFDLELDNSDFELEHAPGKFWYDKILKIYSGVQYVDTTPTISQVVRTNLALNPRAIAATGFSPNNAYWTVTRNEAIAGHPLGIVTAAKSVVSNAASAGSGLASMYNLDNLSASATSRYVGVWVFSSIANTATLYLDGNQTATKVIVSVPANTWTFLKTIAASTGNTILTMNKGSATVNGDTAYVTGTIAEVNSPTGSFDGSTQDFGNRDYAWTATVNNSTSTETITISTPTATSTIWETQVGEFMIDRIVEAHFPHTVKVSGRDYTKKCLLSKFTTATAFADGTPIEDAIEAMALAAGVTKVFFTPTGHSLGKDYFFERGVPRWQAMNEIAGAFGYELFFDAQGYLLLREVLDPVTAPLSYTLATGPSVGNLVTYEKNLNDTRIYNHVIVTGESSDSELIPVAAEAINTEPSSPTRVSELGDRTYQYTSAFITTTLQAQDVADKFLAIHALEEFDLNFASINFPWLEVGEIVEFIDPRPSAGQPTRFLLSSLSLSLGLGAMSGNAKRVTVVG